jgi:hypothetical protein
MGMLDEAIREHLELKRRRGADPTEVAREEREALDTAFSPAQDGEPADGSEIPLEDAPVLDVPAEAPHGPQGDELAEAFEHEPEAAAPVGPGLAEETVEIDMEALLDGDAPQPPTPQDAQPEADAAPGEAAGPVRAGGLPPEHAAEEPLAWATPGEATEPPPEPLPGQERMSFE